MLNCIGIVLYCPNIWKCCIDIVQLTKMLYSSGLATTPSLLLQFQPHGSNPFLGAKISPQYSNSSQAQVIGSFGVALRLSFEHQSRALGLGSGIQQKVWPFLEEFDRILVFRLGGGAEGGEGEISPSVIAQVMAHGSRRGRFPKGEIRPSTPISTAF